MARDVALREAQRLKACLERYGVRVSIELQTGVAGTGWWGGSRWIGNMSHHTVSRRSMGNTPVLGLVKRGRSDVPGPLCNGYGGFDEVARIITMGWANHPGAGGPLTVAGHRVPRNNGRPYFFGWEFEGGLDPRDFTPSYRAFMARCAAGTLDYLNRPVTAHLEHSTWAPGRKIDRLGYTAAIGQREIITLAHNAKDDDMSDYMEKAQRGLTNPQTGELISPKAAIQIAQHYTYRDWKNGLETKAMVEAQADMLKNLSAAVAALKAGEDWDSAKFLESMNEIVDKIPAAVEKAVAESTVKVDVTIAGQNQKA